MFVVFKSQSLIGKTHQLEASHFIIKKNWLKSKHIEELHCVSTLRNWHCCVYNVEINKRSYGEVNWPSQSANIVSHALMAVMMVSVSLNRRDHLTVSVADIELARGTETWCPFQFAFCIPIKYYFCSSYFYLYLKFRR